MTLPLKRRVDARQRTATPPRSRQRRANLMETSELRTACKVRKGGRTVEAAIHLVEVRYCEDLVFWNGVCQFTGENMPRAEKLSRDALPVEVILPDGRTGFLYIVQTHWESGARYEIAGVGISNAA